MAIVLFVAGGYGGYGDFVFALKSTYALAEKLSQQYGYQDKVYLVSDAFEKIITLSSEREFSTDALIILPVDDFNASLSAGEITIDCYLEGPVFMPVENRKIVIPAKTPYLMLTEYSLSPEVRALAQLYQGMFNPDYIPRAFDI